MLLGYRPDVQFAPFYVAQQEGYFADAGLDVTIEHRQAPDVQRLVASGEAEFGVADATDVMIAGKLAVVCGYGEVVASSFDHPADRHVGIAEDRHERAHAARRGCTHRDRRVR